ncbi:MAG: nuclear transport factor 2 family protein [Chitinophagia bacterium]|nr:nuclear transport factor 2 family protein [Chitinophagia bacterium]
MKSILFLLLLTTQLTLSAQQAEQAIRTLLNQQTTAWNRGDLEGFMQGYWKNDSLCFIGKSGVTYGWHNTLANYKKGYPDTTAMGKLQFTILHVQLLSKTYAHVIGKWHLTRSIGNVQGHFTLLLRRLNGQWQIVSDHSS